MSGGSFNYLYSKDVEFPIRDVVVINSIIEELAPRSAASTATTDFVEKLKEIRALKESLEEVWRCVEWMKSADYGRDQVMDAITEFERTEHKR